MRAGSLRYRATLQQPTQTRGASGEAVETFVNVATRACGLVMASGTEADTNGLQRQAEARYVVRMRYDSTVGAATAKWRILISGRTFHIVAPPDNVGNRNRELRFQCREYVN